MRYALLILLLCVTTLSKAEGPRYVTPPYEEPKVVYDFYLDDPQKIHAALFWIRSLINPLMEEPYGFAPEMMEIKVVIHGAEIVTVAKKNYAKYKNAVDRMRYYASLGVQFKVCGLAAQDFDYRLEDFQDFIDVVPSAFTELVHWQQQGYAVIRPTIVPRNYSIEEIR
jgi:intracellular sulfur oxidation DsrE/DsrF family protein